MSDAFHNLTLISQAVDNRTPNTRHLHMEDEPLIGLLNLNAFWTASGLEEAIDEILTDEPVGREEWVER
ncbi:hypothetical protein C482_00835 [Natrialba chahannaoensis JCM 10990]|uniref:Uncharacterized protein n=1 Tax=Natrialba chahannaoensis JCM 10990 TaxID=1227492 RepID=M0B7R2_9EURY|nr:hypothetical protein [Natrialba chahannaoensis]ELZ06323.1 hypothetical protein C482_00835 [Natrialba chahannaoensis JCM 10990]